MLSETGCGNGCTTLVTVQEFNLQFVKGMFMPTEIAQKKDPV